MCELRNNSDDDDDDDNDDLATHFAWTSRNV